MTKEAKLILQTWKVLYSDAAILACSPLRILKTTFNFSRLNFKKKKKKKKKKKNHGVGGPDSSVGIATDYGLGGPGIESRWG